MRERKKKWRTTLRDGRGTELEKSRALASPYEKEKVEDKSQQMAHQETTNKEEIKEFVLELGEKCGRALTGRSTKKGN